ncbi:MAG TPA: hypothetical protein VHD63_15240, partial [Ktedonobacteraceae bacterium]|nr:hypothetical protein [Ktedonobacteraceae bacterium]
LAWLVGILVGLAFTVSPWFIGPAAVGIFATSSLGYLLGFAVSALAYLLALVLFARPSALRTGRGEEELPAEVAP